MKEKQKSISVLLTEEQAATFDGARQAIFGSMAGEITPTAWFRGLACEGLAARVQKLGLKPDRWLLEYIERADK